MMKFFRAPLIIVFCAEIGLAQTEEVTLNEAYSVLKVSAETEQKRSNPNGIQNRVLTGYQGWFRAPGDGSKMGFYHYQKGKKFEPGSCTIDLWPDLSEFDEDEKFDTSFRHQDGSVAQVFSSVHPKTVARHFKWMKEYEIDGAFVQRFGVIGAKKKRSYHHLKSANKKLLLCRDAANEEGRCYALMYDLSGLKTEDFDRLIRDWKELRKGMQLGVDSNDKAYLHHNGKPLVAIWGVGFKDGRQYSLEDVARFIDLLKGDSEWGGMSVMLGTPYGWREGKRDSVSRDSLHPILKTVDIISPWAVGRYREVNFENGRHVQNLVDDRRWCEQHMIDYLPVVYPGFSWHNLKGAPLGAIPRRKGDFLWDQFLATKASGITTAYVAMFDEVDEATAIFKVSDDPPVGEGVQFLDNEGLPSDHYLNITQKGGALLRNKNQ